MTERVHTALVVPEKEIEPMLRAARATVARLSLRLRSVMHEAEQLEESSGNPSKATALLDSSLRQMVEARRRDLARELDAERDRAALLLDSARREAAATAAAIRLETDASDDSASRESTCGPPVPKSQPAGGVAGIPDDGAEPASAQNSVLMREQLPVSPASAGCPDAAPAVAAVAPIAGAPDAGGVLGERTTPPIKAPLAAGVVDVVADHADIADDHDAFTTSHPVVDGGPVHSPADAERQPQPAPAATTYPPETSAPSQPVVANAGPGAVSVLVDVQALTSMVAAAVTAVMAQARPIGRTAPRLVEVAPRRSFGARVLHLDVLLPVLAAAIVLLVLVAWLA